MNKRDKRQEIMQAAEKLFATRRFHEITLDEVARLAKVGKGTIYLHFADKDDLFFQSATSGFDELCRLVTRNVPADAPFDRQLLEACEQITGFFERHRPVFRMMQGEAGRISRAAFHRRMERHRQRLRAAMGRLIAKGVVEGVIRADVRPEVLAGFLLGMLGTRAKDLRDAPPAQRSLRLVLDIFSRGAGFSGQAAGRTP